MKTKFFLTAALLMSSTAAMADIIKCGFTEPFITTTYSMAQQSLTINGDVDNSKSVIKNVSFQIKGPGKFELVAKNGKVLQQLDLNFKGSDGMSDTVYPYDVKYTTQNGGELYGGCTSNYMKTK